MKHFGLTEEKLVLLKSAFKKTLSFVVGVALISLGCWALYIVFFKIWNQFKQLDPQVSIAILTAATTVLVATLTVVLGKYYERVKEIEAHYRQSKTEIYDEFLKEFFKLFFSESSSANDEANPELVAFLREWQRKAILWGGQDVLIKYVDLMRNLRLGKADAQSLFLIDTFFFEIRRDLGHKNNKLPKGVFLHFILRNSDLFLTMAKANPNITLAELGEIEKLIEPEG